MEVVTPAKRGRPKVSMVWPNENFTFKSLAESKTHGLCASSLRNKIRESMQSGEIRKVENLNGRTGRPQNVYAKRSFQVNVSPDVGVAVPHAGFSTVGDSTQTQPVNECNTQVQRQDSVGESTHLS